MRKKLYLIPGTMCNPKLWSELLPYLEYSFDLVYLDIPQAMNFDELAKHYATRLGDEKANLIGFSLGGYIATYFSIAYPEQVEKLFVISNSPTSLPDAEMKQRNDIIRFVQSSGFNGLSRKNVANLLDSNNQQHHLVDLILEMANELGEEELLSQYKFTSERNDLSQSINQLPEHSHFYCSDNDHLVDPQWFKCLKSHSPKRLIINTLGSGHMLPLEKPKELAEYIHSWQAL